MNYVKKFKNLIKGKKTLLDSIKSLKSYCKATLDMNLSKNSFYGNKKNLDDTLFLIQIIILLVKILKFFKVILAFASFWQS